MANVWLDATAPYILVAAVGATGWVVNTSVADLKQANIIEYQIAEAAVGNRYVTNIDIFNRSLSHNLTSGKFSIRCRDMATANCFASGGSPITFIPLSGLSYPSNIEADGPIYTAQARLAPQSGVRYQIGMASPNDKILLLYEPDAGSGAENPGLIFREGESWEGWLIANYLGYMVRLFFGLACLLGLWFVGALVALLVQWLRKPAEPKPKDIDIIRVIIEQRGTLNV